MAREWEEETPDGQEEDLPPILKQQIAEALRMTKSQKIDLLRESGFYEKASDKLSVKGVDFLVKEYLKQLEGSGDQATDRKGKIRTDATMGLSTLRKPVVIQILRDSRGLRPACRRPRVGAERPSNFS